MLIYNYFTEKISAASFFFLFFGSLSTVLAATKTYKEVLVYEGNILPQQIDMLGTSLAVSSS